jgi:hypothetical protein
VILRPCERAGQTIARSRGDHPSRPVPRGAGQRYPPFFRFFYPDRGDFLGFVSDFHFRAHSGFPLEHVATFRFVPGVAWSDHRPFWRHGYRALMVTDTAFYRNTHFHRAEDTPDKLAYPQPAHVTEGLFRSFAVLARQGFDSA